MSLLQAVAPQASGRGATLRETFGFATLNYFNTRNTAIFNFNYTTSLGQHSSK